MISTMLLFTISIFSIIVVSSIITYIWLTTTTIQEIDEDEHTWMYDSEIYSYKN